MGSRRHAPPLVVIAVLLLSLAGGVRSAEAVSGEPCPWLDPVSIDSGYPDGVARGPIPVLVLELFPSQQMANVTQSELGSATFNGEMVVDQMRMEKSTVTLQAVVNTGWPVVLSKQTFEFIGPGTDQFQVTVIVPPATSSLLSGGVIVTGSCKAPGLAPVVASTAAVVTVGQYSKIRLLVDDAKPEVDKGDERIIRMQLHNDGNGASTFTIVASDIEDGLAVIVKTPKVSIEQQENDTLELMVAVETLTDSGFKSFNLQITDEVGGVTEVVRITVDVPSVLDKLGGVGITAVVALVGLGVSLLVLVRRGRLPVPSFLRRRKKGFEDDDAVETVRMPAAEDG